MPFGDGTGPLGVGPRAGGRRGRCAWPGTRAGWSGSGFGRASGGFGRRGFLPEEQAPAEKSSGLDARLRQLEETLAAIRNEIGGRDKK